MAQGKQELIPEYVGRFIAAAIQQQGIPATDQEIRALVRSAIRVAKEAAEQASAAAEAV